MSFEGHGVVLRGRRWLLWLGCVLEAVGVAALARHFVDPQTLPMLAAGVLITVGNVVLTLYGWSARTWPERTAVRLVGGAGGLRVDSRLVPRAALTAGYLLAAPERAVRLVRARRLSMPLDLELGSREEALQLLEALGLGVTHATARFQAVYGGVVRRALMAVGAMIAFLALFTAVMIVADRAAGHGPPPGFNVLFIMMPSLLPVLGQVMFRTTVDVGADGIWLSRGNQFLPYGELLGVTLDSRDLVLARKGSRSIRLGFGGTEQQEQARVACAKRIEEARAAFAKGRAAVRPEALLAPRGRSTVEWVKALRAVADYRSSAVPSDTLWRIVEDPTAAAPMRAGAAVALGHDLDEQARKRLRVAAQTCAAPQLRVAFEVVAEEEGAEEGRLEEVLDKVVKGARAPVR